MFLIAALAGMEAADPFVALDMDRSGALEFSEAVIRPALINQWQTLDRNKDGVLDEAEFAAFENEDDAGNARSRR